MKTILAVTLLVFAILIAIIVGVALFHGVAWVVRQLCNNPPPQPDDDNEMVERRHL